MNKKKIFILLLLLILLPSTVYAAETGEVCVGNERYKMINYAQTEPFKYAGAVRKAQVEASYAWGHIRLGEKREGKILLTPEYYIGGLKKIRDENKANFEKEEYKETCLVPKNDAKWREYSRDRWWNQAYYDMDKLNAIKCKISKSTDDELNALAVDIANLDSGALKTRFGFPDAWEYFTYYYPIGYNEKRDYFSYNGQDNNYKFFYVVESSDFRCRNEKETGKPYALGTTNGTFWVVGKYKFASCPKAEEEKRNVSFDMEKVTVKWSFPQSKWIVTIPDLKGLSVRFIKKDYSGSELDFVHLPFGASETNYNYDINDTFCEASRTGNNCGGGTDYSRYKDVKTSVNNNLLTVTFSPDSGESVFYVGTYNVGGDCDGADIYWHQMSIPTVVENPYVDKDMAKNICTTYLNAMEGNGYPVSFAYAMVPECNVSNTMIDTNSVIGIWTGNTNDGSNGYGGNTYVRQKINNVVNEYSSRKINQLSVSKDSNTTCEFNIKGDEQPIYVKKSEYNGVNTVTYTYTSLLYNDDSHEYWNAFCTEEIILSYLGPRALSNAGAGFTYPIEVQQKRSCAPYQVKKPEAKPVCSYGIECYGGPAHHSGEGGAGPNEDFDNCVLSCDGGEYSQSCINMCYESVYGSADKILGLAWNSNKFTKTADPLAGICGSSNIGKKFTFSREIGGVQHNYTTKAPISSCDIITGNGARGNTKCDEYACISEHGVKYTYLNGCNSRSGTQGTACFEVFTSRTDCLEVNYGGRRVGDANKLIPDNIYESTFKGVCAQNDMNCYKQVSYAEEVDRAEDEYNKVLDDIRVFKENPANTSNYFELTLNDSKSTGYKFNLEEHINVKYKRYSDEYRAWTVQYDNESLNKQVGDPNYSKYVKTVETKENKTFGGNAGALYEGINFGASYAQFYEKYDFNKYKNANSKDIKGYVLERRFVYNLPNTIENGAYTASSNFDYFKAYKYSMRNNSNETIKPNMFMSYSPDFNGINALDIITEGEARWYSWRYYYENGGVEALKRYADTLDDPDLDWNNITFIYNLGTWNQVSKEKGGNIYNDLICFYGIPHCEDSDCLLECQDGKCENTYIFRPIELKNMFPCNAETCIDNRNSVGISQRDPRYNWSEAAAEQYDKSYYGKNYNYTIDAKLVQDTVEQKGEDIYNSDNLNEIDYDFTISKEQIRAIRNYSDGGKKPNFGDYSTMQCEKNDLTGMNVCYSTLLRDNNGKYITYTKLGTLGCNNQKSGNECE